VPRPSGLGGEERLEDAAAGSRDPFPCLGRSRRAPRTPPRARPPGFCVEVGVAQYFLAAYRRPTIPPRLHGVARALVTRLTTTRSTCVASINTAGNPGAAAQVEARSPPATSGAINGPRLVTSADRSRAGARVARLLLAHGQAGWRVSSAARSVQPLMSCRISGQRVPRPRARRSPGSRSLAQPRALRGFDARPDDEDSCCLKSMGDAAGQPPRIASIRCACISRASRSLSRVMSSPTA